MDNTLLKKEILRIKQEQDCVILAHMYQDREIQEIADVTGDSFALAKAAANISSKKVIMCGVYFMAETVKILSPEKQVIIPVASAGCPMAEMLAFEEIKAFKASHPDYIVAAYVNTTAHLKTLADVCVTSSSAEKILKKMAPEKVLFIPDKNLGNYIAKRLPDIHFEFLNGCCPYHDSVSAQDIISLKAEHPEASVAVHPECKAEVTALADMIGATSEIINYAVGRSGKVIIVTERGVTDYLNYKYQTDRFIQAVPEKLVCGGMKAITLESLLDALKGQGESEIIELEEDTRIKAKKSIDAMLKYGN